MKRFQIYYPLDKSCFYSSITIIGKCVCLIMRLRAMLSMTSYFQFWFLENVVFCKVCVIMWESFIRCIQLYKSIRHIDPYIMNHVFLPESILTTASFVSNRHFRKKWASGKPSSKMSGYGLNTVNFLFGSCASCIWMLLIYLFTYLFIITGFIFLNFFQIYYMLKQTEAIQNLRQLLTIKVILLLCQTSSGAYCRQWHMRRSEVRS